MRVTVPAPCLSAFSTRLPERLLEAAPVAAEAESRWGFDGDFAAGCGGSALVAGGGGFEQRERVDRLRVDRQPSVVGAGEDEEVVGELGKPIGIFAGGDEGRA
ncbi:MAG: hypothetical protein R3C15_07435 [Thermoleophilia bacterium]